MHTPLIYEALATLRCAERQREALRNWQIEQALAKTRTACGRVPLLRQGAFSVAWRLTRLAGADSGPYTVKERATLVDAQGNLRTVCPEEIYVVLLPRTDRDAA
jgi:hypothetical protein